MMWVCHLLRILTSTRGHEAYAYCVLCNFLVTAIILLIQIRVAAERELETRESKRVSPLREGPGPGLGPSPGWGPVRVGAHMGPYGPIYGPPYGPLWAHVGPILLNKSLVLMKNHKIVNENIKV